MAASGAGRAPLSFAPGTALTASPRRPAEPPAPLYLGVDIGTSGCRGVAIDAAGDIHANASVSLPPPRREGAKVEQAPSLWWSAMVHLLQDLAEQVSSRAIVAIAVDGTSGTVLLTDANGEIGRAHV